MTDLRNARTTWGDSDLRAAPRVEERAAQCALRWRATLGVAAFLVMTAIVAGVAVWARIRPDLALATGGCVGIWTGTPIGLRLGTWLAARFSGSNESRS